MIPVEELEALVGRRFPGGSTTIEPYRHWLMSDATLDAPPRTSGVASPIWVYHAAVAGMGLTFDELFALCGASAADGPMFGEAGIEVHRPLEIGATYDVSGEITDVSRKEGRKAGVFDIVSFKLELSQNGEIAAASTNSFIFPRKP